MSSIHDEGKVLFISNLPPGLINRKHLSEHFSAFGTVKHISLDKNLGNCLIYFRSNLDAQNAKLKGKLWKDISLNISWDTNSNLDSRSFEGSEQSYESNEEVVESLWSDDDKECFGIDEDKTSRAFKIKKQKTFNDLISFHLKLGKQRTDGAKVKVVDNSPQNVTKYIDIRRKEESVTPISRSSYAENDKPTIIKNVNQVVASKDSDLNLRKSVLKRKIILTKDISKSKIKGSLTKTKRPSGESVLKRNKDVPGVSILEGHRDHFTEKKIVEAKETGSLKQISTEIKKRLKPKESFKTIKKPSSQYKLINIKPKQLIKPLKVPDDNFTILKNKIAFTLKEKYSLLDERDKILRKLEVKDSNVKTAEAMKGTCPDMCPEKERIMRSFQRLVSVYEMALDKNEMLEHLAVKIYSRSSADQDEPLPHELRPEPVLTMTMNYLITKIITRVENPEENISEWYNFCWDRLRGIRKDIIQQQLCDLQTVEIIEQCARFHIFCYDYLWGLDVSIFDDKINIENLMNCLQTLMHMYEDLAKQDIYCPNEGEFNAYMIVLKLSSGDLLWEYKSFSPEVRVSPFIKAAINLYNAFHSKISKRFFNTVKQLPYLLACLSHRFFYDMRTRALEVIVKAYTLGASEVTFPLEYMKTNLKFDSIEDTVIFCENHGILLNENKKEFHIKKGKFYEPESVVHVKSFSSMIKNMRLTPAQAVVGENKEIPKYIPHELHSSFDSEGKLKPDALNASDQLRKVSERFSKITSTSERENIESLSTTRSPTLSFTSKNISKANVEDKKGKLPFKFVLPPITSSNGNTPSTTNVPVSPVFKTPDNSFVEHDVLQIPVDDLPQDLYDPFYDTQGNQVNDIQSVEIDAERVEEIYQDVKKYYEHVHEPEFKEASNKPVDSLSVKENKDLLPVLAKSTFSFTLNDKESISSTVKEKVLHDSGFPSQILKLPSETKNKFKLDEEKKKIESMIKEREKQRQEELLRLQKEQAEMTRLKREMEAKRRKEIEEARLLKKLKKDLKERLKVVNARFYAKRWKEKVERLKKSRAEFPMLVQLSVKDHLTHWGSVRHLKQPSSFGIAQRLKERNTITNIVNKVLLSEIPNSVSYCGDLLAEQIAKAALEKLNKKITIRPIFWKLIVSIPKAVNKDTFTLTKLIEIWCKKMFYKNDAALGSVQCIMTSVQIPVYICVHLVTDVSDVKLCNGMSSLMFVSVNQWEATEQTVHRFLSLVTHQNSQNGCFVSVMKIGGFSLEEELKKELIACKDDEFISDWMFQEWSNPNCVSQSLNIMAQNIDLVPEICAAPIDFVLKEIVTQFFSALSADWCTSIGLRNESRLPNNIIRLFNICIGKLEDILLNSKLEKHSHFPEEFKPYISQVNVPGGIEQFSGNNYDKIYKMKISNIIKSLVLPEFTNWPPKTCSSLLKMLKSYCATVNNLSLVPKIVRLIDYKDDDDLEEHLGSVSWISITELWAQQVISQQIQSLRKNHGIKYLVLYNKQELDELVTSQWWLKAGIVMKFEE